MHLTYRALVVDICLLVLMCASGAMCADAAANLSPTSDLQKYPGIDQWMLSNDIEFHPAGYTWYLVYDSSLMVKWGDQDVYLKNLTAAQKTYLWEKMSTEQRLQMNEEYGKIGFGMGGPLQQRPAEWGPELNARIAEWNRDQSGWTAAYLQRLENAKPQAGKDFAAEKNAFIADHPDELDAQEIKTINDEAVAVAQLTTLIGQLQLRKVEIAVKGISTGLIGIITDYFTGFLTSGVKPMSELIGTGVGKMIDLARGSADKQMTPGEMIAHINEQISIATETLNGEMGRQRDMWQQMIGEEPTPDPEPNSTVNADLSILFLVDCSGSMDGSKIEAARQAVANSVTQTNNGKTEWALLGFGRSCTWWTVVPFTTDAAAVQNAVSGLAATGSTPLHLSTYDAITYLMKNGHGKAGRLIILCDGENNCNASGPGAETAASAALRTIVKTYKLTGGSQQP